MSTKAQKAKRDRRALIVRRSRKIAPPPAPIADDAGSPDHELVDLPDLTG